MAPPGGASEARSDTFCNAGVTRGPYDGCVIEKKEQDPGSRSSTTVPAEESAAPAQPARERQLVADLSEFFTRRKHGRTGLNLTDLRKGPGETG